MLVKGQLYRHVSMVNMATSQFMIAMREISNKGEETKRLLRSVVPMDLKLFVDRENIVETLFHEGSWEGDIRLEDPTYHIGDYDNAEMRLRALQKVWNNVVKIEITTPRGAATMTEIHVRMTPVP